MELIGSHDFHRTAEVAVVGPVFGVSDDETGQLVALAFAKAEAWELGVGGDLRI